MAGMISIDSRRLFILALVAALFLLAAAACDQVPPIVPTTAVVESPVATRTTRPTATAKLPTRMPTGTPSPISSLEVDLGELDGMTIEFWHAWDDAAGSQIEALVKQFNQLNEWGLTVNTRYLDGYDEIFDQVNAEQEDSEAPDLVVAYLHQAQAWDENGEVADLTTFVEDVIWGWKPGGQVDFYPVFWEQDLVDDKRLGVPAQRSGQLLFYNVSWASSLGFDSAPRSPEEFTEQACAAAAANLEDAELENDGTGGWAISTEYPAVLGWLYAFDAQIVGGSSGSEGSGYHFDTLEVEDAFTFLRSLYDDGCAWLSESSLPGDDFANRRALFVVGSVIDIPHQVEALDQAGGRDRWTVIPFPSPVDRPAHTVYGPSYSVLASSTERQLASWLLIKWLSTPERQARLAMATGAYPLRASTLPHLDDYGDRYPQWRQAVDELTNAAHGEPQLASWRLVRWTLSDAATQLFRSYFSIDQVPEMLEFWDRMASELHTGSEE